MKRLDIIVHHDRIGKVSDCLRKNDIGGLTFYDIKGRGRSKYEPEHVGTGVIEYTPDFGTWIKIEVLVADSKVKKIVDDILQAISRGSASDGKVFVYDVAEAIDIGTKKTGDEVL
ncbi:MAG TPA: P-II family nitrogen regulator [Nitrososphaeraceae archaeon]|jgi:nitrogen regulatory protein P-II 1|nr:P-II family nitrogen regulator [Nitrososphaeraceae archaeon]